MNMPEYVNKWHLFEMQPQSLVLSVIVMRVAYSKGAYISSLLGWDHLQVSSLW